MFLRKAFQKFLIYFDSDQLFSGRENSQILLFKDGFRLKTGNFGKNRQFILYNFIASL